MASATIAVAIMAVGGGGNTGSLVGTWWAVSMGTPGNTVACPGEVVIGSPRGFTYVSSCGANDLTRFDVDGTFESVSANEDQSSCSRFRSTWTLEGTRVTVPLTGQAQS